MIFTLVERQMDITEGHRTFESRAICAELIGKHLVAIGDKEMNVSKRLDKATPPCVTLGQRRGLLSLISHSMKVLKSRYQQAARHFSKWATSTLVER